MKKRSYPMPVEKVLNIYDEHRQWYYIPGFNGYEISNDFYVRSMKNFRKYPFGILLKPLPIKECTYEMSNDSNERVRMTIPDILQCIKNSNRDYRLGGYPRHTWETNCQSRNKREFMRKGSKYVEKVTIPHFCIIMDDDE